MTVESVLGIVARLNARRRTRLLECHVDRNVLDLRFLIFDFRLEVVSIQLSAGPQCSASQQVEKFRIADRLVVMPQCRPEDASFLFAELVGPNADFLIPLFAVLGGG